MSKITSTYISDMAASYVRNRSVLNTMRVCERTSNPQRKLSPWTVATMWSKRAVPTQTAAQAMPGTGLRGKPNRQRQNVGTRPESIVVDDWRQAPMGDMLLALSELPPSEVQFKFDFCYGL